MKKEVECQGKQAMITDSNQEYFVKMTRRRVEEGRGEKQIIQST
jgi:hypothetical protein